MRAHHLKLVYLCLALIILICIGLAPQAANAAVKGAWVKMSPGFFAPSPRNGHAMVYTPRLQRVFLFGGIDSAGKKQNDAWVWKDDVWDKATSNNPPSARSEHRMAYTPEGGWIILYGGDNDREKKTWRMNRWSWSSITNQDPTADKPEPRDYHAMAYDPVLKQVFTCGGITEPATGPYFLQDVWYWGGGTGTYWKRSSFSLPKPRHRHRMAFDYVNNKLILFGGKASPGTFTDSPMKIMESTFKWKDLQLTNMPPDELCDFAMASDKDLKRVVIFGGRHPLNDGKLQDSTWVWDGAKWEKAVVRDKPSARWGCDMTYDHISQEFILFGGVTANGKSGETWLFRLAATRYVDANSINSVDAGACIDKTKPCKSISYAIRRSVPGDEIFLAAGDYTTANQKTVFTNKNIVFIDRNITIKGGYDSTFSNVTGFSRIVGSPTKRCIKTGYDLIVNLSGLELTKGEAYAGGGLLSAGGDKGSQVNLSNVRIAGNKATAGGGIFVSVNTKLKLEKCQLAANQAEQGGGVYINKGELTLIDSKVELNIAQAPTGTDFGGGIAMDSGKLVLIRSAINKNHADHGGGIYAFNLEAGGRTDGSPPPQVQMQSSTLALNKAAEKGAGIYAKTGKFVINSSTIAGNETDETAGAEGGGIFNDKGEIKMSNTILAANKSLKGGDCLGKIDTLGFNLIGDTSQCQAAWKQGDLHPPSGKLLDPKLEPFADSWGGYPLKIDSPAKGKANPAPAESGPAAVPKYDQRNVEREKHWPPDIGAYEEDKKVKPQMPATGLMEIAIYIGMGLIIALMVFRLVRRKKG